MNQFEFKDHGEGISKRDKNLFNQEVHKEIGDSAKNKETKYRMYEKIEKDLSSLIKDYFPDEYKKFKPPSFARLFDSFSASINFFRDTDEGTVVAEADKKIGTLVAAGIIRFVDDFIDETLWPHIPDYSPEVLLPHFKSFLERALALAQFYDPTMPDTIIKLPLLEIDLELNPTQANFDKNIIGLIEHKSLDLYYIDQLNRGHSIDAESIGKKSLWYIIKSLEDLARDFHVGSYTKEKDFNIHNYLTRNDLNPHVLINYIKKVISEIKGEEDDSPAENCRYILKEIEEIENIKSTTTQRSTAQSIS